MVDIRSSFFTAGGRVLGITALEKTLNTALEKAYKAVNFINFERIHYRKDIGKY
jgi:phosphoribosylamine--glycine ligase